MSKIVASNRKAHHDYFVEETYEGGLALLGTEVKAVRAHKVSMSQGWVMVSANGELFLEGVHIGHYAHGNIHNHAETRQRKILLHRREISKISMAVERRGYTIVPLKVYFKGPWIKVEIGVCRGKKQHDKRHTLREKQAKRELSRIQKKHNLTKL